MNDIDTKIILNLEIENLDFISKINILSQELYLSLEELILYSIEKIIVDIEYIRKMRH